MMFAIAMATAPACLVLDEPTSALDEASKLLVEEMLKKRGNDSCISWQLTMLSKLNG